MSDWNIPLSDLAYDENEEQAVLRVVRSRWLSMGPEVEAFENEFAALTGTRYAFAVSNGTTALHLAYAALEIAAGDEIIQPAISFVASANMTLALGAQPVFADIVGLDEPTISPDEIRKLISPKTKAVVVMHYGGYFCRMSEIAALCQEHGLALIEDACHAVGAIYQDEQGRSPHGQKAGNLGDVGTFSFFSNKNIAIGEGGMVTLNREDLATRVRLLRSHGMTTLTWDRHRGHASSYDVVQPGYNYRLDELHAALGRAQLAKLFVNNQRRSALAQVYREEFLSIPNWILTFANCSSDSAYHLMTVVAPNKNARQVVVDALRMARIQTSLHYPCIPDFSAFSAYQTANVPCSREYAARVVTLPLYPTLQAEQVREICRIIRDVNPG